VAHATGRCSLAGLWASLPWRAFCHSNGCALLLQVLYRCSDAAAVIDVWAVSVSTDEDSRGRCEGAPTVADVCGAVSTLPTLECSPEHAGRVWLSLRTSQIASTFGALTMRSSEQQAGFHVAVTLQQ
jgi:hypothetical protein